MGYFLTTAWVLTLALGQPVTETTTSSTATTAAPIEPPPAPVVAPPPAEAPTKIAEPEEPLDPELLEDLETEDVGAYPNIELIIYSAGPDLYSFWGHAAIRVIEPSGRDVVYNFGSVDFSGNFLLRLLRGRVVAYVSRSTAKQSFDTYRAEDRTIVRRKLNIPAKKRRALAKRLASYVENDRFDYRYDHFADNCSTRVAMEIDSALDGKLKVEASASEDRTYRERALAMVRSSTILYVFLDVVMTDVIDEPINRWQASFLPHVLATAVDAASIDGEPLVAEKIVVYESVGLEKTKRDFGWPWVKIYMLLVLPIAAFTYWRPRVGALFSGLVFSVLGVAILLLWFGTTYDFVKGNVNLALFWPTHIWLFFVALSEDRFRRRGRYVRIYVYAYLTVVLGLAVADAAHLVDQSIGPMIGLVLPVTVMLAVKIRDLGTEQGRRANMLARGYRGG